MPIDLIRSYPAAELTEQVGTRLSPPALARPWNYFASALFDQQVSRATRHARIVHAFEHSALYTLQRARRNGAITVLEQPIIHIDRYRQLEEETRLRTNSERLERPPGYWTHVRRKHREYTLADYCFVGLPTARDTMVDGGFPPENVFVTPYGVPSGWTPSMDEQPRTLGPNLRALFVGHVDFYKGLDVILDAFALLPENGFTLTLVGLIEPSWQAHFMARIDTMRNVTYLPPVPAAQMKDIYAEHDVLAVPSRVGGIGLATFEALASGLVVLIPDSESMLENGQDCVVVPLDDPAAWASALRNLRHAPEKFEQMSRTGLKTARQVSTSMYLDAVRSAYLEIARRERIGDMQTLLQREVAKSWI